MKKDRVICSNCGDAFHGLSACDMTEKRAQATRQIIAQVRRLQETVDRMMACVPNDATFFDGAFGAEVNFAAQVLDGLNGFVVRRREIGL